MNLSLELWVRDVVFLSGSAEHWPGGDQDEEFQSELTSVICVDPNCAPSNQVEASVPALPPAC